MWRILRRMFGQRPKGEARDPSAAQAASESHSQAKAAKKLISELREAASARRLANARRQYEERLHGTGGH